MTFWTSSKGFDVVFQATSVNVKSWRLVQISMASGVRQVTFDAIDGRIFLLKPQQVTYCLGLIVIVYELFQI